MGDTVDESVAGLAATVLEEEDARHRAAADSVVFPDELLPGVGGDEMALREGLQRGGYRTFATLLALSSFDELETGAVAVLGPDIGDSFGVSDGTITAIATASLMFFVLGAGPMGWLADRLRRGPIVGFASLTFAAFSAMTGAAVNALMFFGTRFFTGMSKANTLTVHPSLLADTYPLEIRGRMYTTVALFGRVFAAVGPLLAGGIAVWVGGDDGWRWSFYLIGLPVAVLGLLAFVIREPERGQWEKQDVLSGEPESTATEVESGAEDAPISVEHAFGRIWSIGTVRSMTIALAAMGFALFPAASIQAFFLEEEFGLDALERGLAIAPAGLGVVIVLPLVGRRFDALFRSDPSRALRLIGLLLVPLAFIVPLQYYSPNVGLFVVFSALFGTFLSSAFALVQPSLQSVLPYRLRGMGTAILTFFMVMVGGVGGSVVAGFLQDEIGERPTIIIVTTIAMPVGAWYVLRGAGQVRSDLSLLVAELREEQEEHQRRLESGGDVPALQIADVEFSYGQVQVLFDLGFEVKKGETLALLGTNGAGKSTILKVVTGLVTPVRGVVRLNGRTITYATAEQRAAMGIHMLPGGAGVWSDLTVRDNLVLGAFAYRSDPADRDRRIDRGLELFPELHTRLDDRAGDLSGGQQQMVALGRVMLHEPEILVIDELSLGLAPSVVQSLLRIIDDLREQGQTMIIVEQSLNVALAVADRGVCLEMGQVRFEGDAKELAERDDLARAVFLGSEGG